MGKLSEHTPPQPPNDRQGLVISLPVMLLTLHSGTQKPGRAWTMTSGFPPPAAVSVLKVRKQQPHRDLGILFRSLLIGSEMSPKS